MPATTPAPTTSTASSDPAASQPASAPPGTPPELAKFFLLRGDQIDYATVELECAHFFDKSVPVESCLTLIDCMAKELRPLISPVSGDPLKPRQKIEILANYVHKTRGYRSRSPEEGGGRLLHELLDRRGGNCWALSALYLSLGRRLDLRLKLVPAIQHVFVRWDDGAEVINIEPVDGGRIYTPESFRTRFQVELDLPCYLRSLSPSRGLGLSVGNVGAWALTKNAGNKDALLCLNAALARERGTPELLLSRTEWMLGAKRYADALADADKAINLHPTYAEAWVKKGRALELMGDRRAALSAFQKGCQYDPQCTEAWADQAILQCVLGHFRQSADASFHIVREIDKNNASAWRLAGVSLLLLEDYQQALACANQAVRADPNDFYNWRLKAESHIQLGQYVEGRECIRKAQLKGGSFAKEMLQELEAKMSRRWSGPKTLPTQPDLPRGP
jgi:tetratricopeptide (TPR) repeat protein